MLRRAASTPSLSNPTRKIFAHAHGQPTTCEPTFSLVILCSAHQPCLCIKKKLQDKNPFPFSWIFLSRLLRICFSHVFLLGLFSPERRPTAVCSMAENRYGLAMGQCVAVLVMTFEVADCCLQFCSEALMPCTDMTVFTLTCGLIVL